MTDSFADLWASSAPTKPTPQPLQKKSGSTAPQRRPQYDAFSILSASQPSNRLANNQPSDRPSRQPQTNSNGGDAFSDLFTPSLDGTAARRNPDRVNMTMAERAALAQRAKVAHNSGASARVGPPSSSPSLWDGLDVLARPATASPRPPVSIQGNVARGESSGFSQTESRSIPVSAKPVPGPQPTTLWDLDGFRSSEPQISQPQPNEPPRSLTGTPGDFDFGDREDGLLGADNSDVEDTFGIRGSEHLEDDILGDLGKPVSHSHTPSPNPSTSTRNPVRSPRTSSSPPPHITGQLVEMGFTPVDARAALVNTMTEDGFDVQAATELLLSQAGEEGPARPSPPPPPERQQRRRNGDRDRDRDREARPRPPSRTHSGTQLSNPPQPNSQSQPQLDMTAEKLLSQASEIGRGMFSKANALWKEGKERAVKMYEERAATSNAANGASTSDGRPRWMRDQTNGSSVVQAGFRDDEDEEHGMEQKERQRSARRPARSPLQSQSHTPPQPERDREVDLFSADSPTAAYQSPFRRGKPKSQSSPAIQSCPSAPSLSAQTSSGPSISQRTSQPPHTLTTTIALSVLTTSTSHKSAGTDAYKRGDFPAALAAYTRALSALPPEHILRVPILTNIALVRSKVGELRDTIKACEEAVVLVRRFVGGADGVGRGLEEMSLTGAESHFDEKAPVEVGTGKVSVSIQGGGGSTSSENLPTSVDLVEGLSKAFRRRADALEGLEKWRAAQSTWEALLCAEWAGAGLKGDAIKGVDRCRRMVDDGGAHLAPPSAPAKPRVHARPKPKPAPKSTASTPPSAALTALRYANDAQQTEDAARLACKDTVDARLVAWKSGREGNIRALLTSLDETILWPELGWRKVGMAEVVSKGQVKGAYVRAIARVHPDKLNAGNTTVEQRMVANGVFGALNEAWNAFQQQQV